MRANLFIGVASIFLSTFAGPAMSADVAADSHAATREQVNEFSQRYGSMPGAANTATPNRSDQSPESVIGRPRSSHNIVSRTATPNATEISGVVERYGSLPGGIVMEGTATGLDAVATVRYDAKTNTLILGNDLAFRPEATMQEIASLARALAEDDRIGVSITDEDVIAFGAIPEETRLARSLAVADIFLVDFVVPPREWTEGYRLADSYTPATIDTDDEIVAFYSLHDFAFTAEGGEVSLTKANVNLFVVPVLSEPAEDGGYLPDLAALDSGSKADTLALVQKNADHMAANFSYYANERAARRAIAIGEVAAVLRHLKSKGVDLEALADEIDTANAAPENSDAVDGDNLDVAWEDYLHDIQAEGDFANWSSPPYDLYMKQNEANKEASLVTPNQ